MPSKFIPIIKTKLAPPRIAQPILARPRLLKRFEKHMKQSLTLLMGPAGYGKTTLMSQWQERLISDGYNTAWLTLDDGDNVPDQFLSYFCSAFKKLEPSMSVQIEEFDDLGSARVPQYVIAELVNGLAEKEQKYGLFLDDYHFINQEQIHSIMQYLLSNLPPNLYIYVGTRVVPPFSLSRLKVADQVHLIGSESLRFDSQEAEQFLSDRTNIALEPQEINLLLERTEGWPAALQLASPSLARMEEREAFIENFTGDHRSITDFLAEEVLNRLPEKTLNVLLQLSVVDRFCSSLCTALTGEVDVQEILENPQSDSFLLQRFDDEVSWYRFHPLVRGFLRKRLEEREAAGIASLHEKAAQWFEQHGLITEALQHLLNTGKQDRALVLIEQSAFDIVEQGHLALLISLVRKLPQGQIATCEKILVPLAWAQLLSYQNNELQHLLDQMEALIQHADPEQRRSIELEISVIRAALYAYADDFNACQALASQWSAYSSIDSPFNEATMGNIREYLCLTSYQFDEVYACQQRSQPLYNQLENPGTKVYGRLFSILALIEQMRIAEAKNLCFETLEICKRSKGNGAIFQKLTTLLKCIIAYYSGQSDKALALFESNFEALKQYAVTGLLVKAFPLMVRAYEQQNNAKKARGILSQIAFLGRSRGLIRIQACVLHEQIRALLLDNEYEAASRLFEQSKQQQSQADELSVVEEEACEWYRLAEGRLLIAAGKSQQAGDILQQLQARFQSQDRRLRLFEVYLLQAQLASVQGDKKTALGKLATALSLAQDEQFIQPFVDEGRNLLPLYQTLAVETSGSSTGELCYAIIERLNDAPKPASNVSVSLSEAGSEQQLTDPLSKRELEVLQLVAQGLSNRDIAEQLYLSIDTIKTHLKSIFSKMAVARRTQAVGLGRELKLID
ncbi:MAG: LuxR C-terminal-related transcriptional regulator [Amphritea sp.]